MSRQLGDASIQITADLYGHLFRETSVVAMRRLEHYIPEGKNLPEETEAGATAADLLPSGNMAGDLTAS